MKETQRQWVEKQLAEYGEISRNTCLRNYISRLGAIIKALKYEGWVFHTEKREGDYVYILGEKPKQKMTKWVLKEKEDGSRVRVPEDYYV